MRDIDIRIDGIYREDDEVKRARERAMTLLSYSEYTVASMYKRLTDEGFSKDITDEVIGYLVERGYINEKDYFIRFCRHYAEKSGYGRKRIELLAKSRGFSKKVISENGDEAFDDIDFEDICLERLKKIRGLDISDKKSRDKAIASLMRRGFEFSQIKNAVSMLAKEEE